ncbi:MAG TPA: sugar ABC transporter permease [Acidisoma sp.]|uniref:carbohydrate ABC transporter permease n=1 Tax=Acidisoma sp. TaxID=1872115 RepID=UPI002CD54CC3|nr:sugar ABC transporter permease [Acidisoma sp.]HTI02276.1 sugar ABC transporter permease [Acidisoma sp.]
MSDRVQDRAPPMAVAPPSWREKMEPWFFILPSVILLLAIGLYPVIYTLVASLQSWVMGMGPPSFGGLQNYAHAFTSSDFGHSVLRTLVLIVITLPIELALGMMIALALDSQNFLVLRRLLQICLVIPIAITPSVVGLLTQLMFNQQLGIINHLLGYIGIPALDWLGRPLSAYTTVLIVQIWEWTPFVALVLSAALSTVPQDIDEAAVLETERWWPRFRSIQLPFMWPGITAALVFQTAFTIKEFDMIYTIEKGGPGTATETAVMQIERMAFRGFDVGLAAAESILMLVLSILLARIYIRVFYREMD